jgi:hypothetical protein
MKKIILLAETGSDVNVELAKEYGVEIVPMHVSFDTETLDDGAFPVEKIVDYYQTTGKLPKTSGSMPDDFEIVLDRIHAENPDAQILYLAYSAVTTCSTFGNHCIRTNDDTFLCLLVSDFLRLLQGKFHHHFRRDGFCNVFFALCRDNIKSKARFGQQFFSSGRGRSQDQFHVCFLHIILKISSLCYFTQTEKD